MGSNYLAWLTREQRRLPTNRETLYTLPPLPTYVIGYVAMAPDLGSRGRYPSARPSISSHRNRIASHLISEQI